MRYLFFISTLWACVIAQAYLVQGVRTTLLIKEVDKSKIIKIFFEGCDKNSCSKAEYKSECAEEKLSKFYCHMKDQYPKFVRFVVKLEGNKILTSKFIPTNGDSVLDNFSLNLTQNTVTIETVKFSH